MERTTRGNEIAGVGGSRRPAGKFLDDLPKGL